MSQYEHDYMKLVKDIFLSGQVRPSRVGNVLGVYMRTLCIHDLDRQFPLLQARKMYPKGILGEFAAMIRGPKHIDDFRKWGCNYWDKWAKPDGSIEVDYGNQWIDYNGVNQLERLIEGIKKDPTGRRHIVDGWRPDRLADLSLPCCHFLYQWYVNNDGTLDMIWYQRSVDVMIGLPSDVVLAAVWNLLLCNETGYRPGRLYMMLADCHIYNEHLPGAERYLKSFTEFYRSKKDTPVTYSMNPFASLTGPLNRFVPDDLTLIDYRPAESIHFELKS